MEADCLRNGDREQKQKKLCSFRSDLDHRRQAVLLQPPRLVTDALVVSEQKDLVGLTEPRQQIECGTAPTIIEVNENVIGYEGERLG
jgi:hypothetical protein